jgi:hypothetical protein
VRDRRGLGLGDGFRRRRREHRVRHDSPHGTAWWRRRCH